MPSPIEAVSWPTSKATCKPLQQQITYQARAGPGARPGVTHAHTRTHDYHASTEKSETKYDASLLAIPVV